jgi:peptidoglycan/xylan/chitin deacetylase (PgdA/CDA1 family)
MRHLVASTLEVRLRLSRRRIGGVLLYHRIDDPGTAWDPRGLNYGVPRKAFAAHLRYLRARYRLVPPSQLLEAARRRRFGERIPLAVTFDDDYRSHLTQAMPLLVEAGTPAAFFICGAALDRPFAFWWERLERAVAAGAIEIDTLREMVPALRGGAAGDRNVREIAADIERMDLEPRDQLAAELERRLGGDPPDSGLRAEQLRELAAAGFEIGFHTRRHPNLAVLADNELPEALVQGREEIERVLGQSLRTVAYPGGWWNQRVARVAADRGFELGFTTDPRPNDPGTDPLAIGRLAPVWCDTADQLALALVRMLRRDPATI